VDLDLLRVAGGSVVLAVVLVPADEFPIFLQSTLTTGIPAAKAAATVSPMWRNCASRSGCWAPSSVLSWPAGCSPPCVSAAAAPPVSPRRDVPGCSTDRPGPATTSRSSAAGSSGPHASRGRPTCPTPRAGPGRVLRRVCARRPDRASGPPAAVPDHRVRRVHAARCQVRPLPRPRRSRLRPTRAPGPRYPANPTLTLGQMRLDRVVTPHEGFHDRGHSTDGSYHEAQNQVISLRVHC
jgi:hypothetical protein